MNEEASSPPHQEKVSENATLLPDATQHQQGGAIPESDSLVIENRSRYRSRRSEKGRRGVTPPKLGSQKRGSKGRRNKLTPQERTEKMILIGCLLLGGLACVCVGYYLGQKSKAHVVTPNYALSLDAPYPSAEAETLLDSGFKALNGGNYREAMISFQKAQDAQPALYGLDFLIATAAYKAGESALADDAVSRALSKNESVAETHALTALMTLEKSKSLGQDAQQLADPNVTAQSEIKQLIATHLGDARSFVLWGDLLRSTGEYRSAIDVLHKGVLRADPLQSKELLSAKEQLARLQNTPAKTVPSLSELTSMSAEQALVAALAALQVKQSEEAAVFLERARDLYSAEIFAQLMNDAAFFDYHTDDKVKSYFKSGAK